MLVILAGSPSPAVADEADVQELFKTRVEANINQLPLRQALKLLLRSPLNVPIIVDPGVPDTLVKVIIRQKPFFEAFQEVIRAASTEKTRIHFGICGDVICVALNPNTPEEEKKGLGAGRKVTLSFKEIPLHRAMDMIFMGSGLQYSIHPAARLLPVTVELKETPIELALALLESAVSKTQPLAVTKEGDVYVIRKAP